MRGLRRPISHFGCSGPTADVPRFASGDLAPGVGKGLRLLQDRLGGLVLTVGRGHIGGGDSAEACPMTRGKPPEFGERSCHYVARGAGAGRPWPRQRRRRPFPRRRGGAPTRTLTARGPARPDGLRSGIPLGEHELLPREYQARGAARDRSRRSLFSLRSGCCEKPCLPILRAPVLSPSQSRAWFCSLLAAHPGVLARLIL